MTMYSGREAELAFAASFALVHEYRVLLRDLVAAFLGYMAWLNFKDFNSREREPWAVAQLNYEVVYYLHRLYLDRADALHTAHHVLCLGYLYTGWAFKTALATSFYFGSVSNCFMSLMQKHRNNFTKLSFAVAFFVARLVYGTWIMWRVAHLPAQGREVLLKPMASAVYVMQWWWGLHIFGRLKKTWHKYLNGSDAA